MQILKHLELQENLFVIPELLILNINMYKPIGCQDKKLTSESRIRSSEDRISSKAMHINSVKLTVVVKNFFHKSVWTQFVTYLFLACLLKFCRRLELLYYFTQKQESWEKELVTGLSQIRKSWTMMLARRENVVAATFHPDVKTLKLQFLSPDLRFCYLADQKYISPCIVVFLFYRERHFVLFFYDLDTPNGHRRSMSLKVITWNRGYRQGTLAAGHINRSQVLRSFDANDARPGDATSI